MFWPQATWKITKPFQSLHIQSNEDQIDNVNRTFPMAIMKFERLEFKEPVQVFPPAATLGRGVFPKVTRGNSSNEHPKLHMGALKLHMP